MNRNLIATLIILTVAAAMIVGGTMAWFTSGDETDNTLFTAGTVELSFEEPTTFGSIDISNVNPGDSFEAEWTFNNNGTKRMVYKVDFIAGWNDLVTAGAVYNASSNVYNNRFAQNSGPEFATYSQPKINLKNVSFQIWDVEDQEYKTIGVTGTGIGVSSSALTTDCNSITSGAVSSGDVKVEKNIYTDERELNEAIVVTGASINVTGGPITVVFNGASGEEYDLNKYTLYYTGAPLLGSYDEDLTPESIDMKVKVVFDGEKTHNGYQAAKFYFNGISEAVQPTNNAPYEIWGVNFYNYLQDSSTVIE